MSPSRIWLTGLRNGLLTVAAIAIATPLGLYAFTDFPAKWGWSTSKQQPADNNDPASQAHEGKHQHGHDDHAHADHDAGNSVELTPQARANMQLEIAPLKVGVYTEYVEVPGVIASWPGRTHIAVTSPLTGVLNAIYVSRGELVESNKPLFSLRLTHQDLVKTQEIFLTKLGELDIEVEEIAQGAISEKAQ